MANNLVRVKHNGQPMVMTDQMIIEKTNEFIEGMRLPDNYQYTNAIKSFCLALPDVKGIENATARSVFLAAQSYVSKGLDISKNQCALIMYGDKLTLQKQYQGNTALAKKSNSNIKDIIANTIFEGDKIEIEKINGRTIVHHQTSFENMNNKVIGAYATVIYDDGTVDNEIMPISMIEMSWSMTRAGTSTHKKFPSQMAEKTLLNKLSLRLINSSIDSESPDFVKDEMEQYEEKENLNDKAFDEDNVIDMGEVVISDVVPTQEPLQQTTTLETKFDNDNGMTIELKQELNAKRQQILDELGMDDPLKKEEPQKEEYDEVLARFEKMKNEPVVEQEPSYDILDGKHCEKCGKELSPTAIAYFDKHPDLARLCYKCSNEEANK